ncbi:immunoglobulin domain-containing protein [Paenibacillus sp. MBLB4367]|uniref:immunoglobulin domain-containing protein n=1 Tax=Paenibacillus sp. MBLB4367 TaxID=3384767 RepID=UPI0039081C9F
MQRVARRQRLRIAKVTVNALTHAAAPSINTQPSDQTVNEGGNATLNVAASGGVALSYQWYRNTTNSTNGSTAILNATSASYTAPTVVAGTTYYYSVVTNTDASATGSQTATATSSIAKVTVNALTHAATPSINTQPSDQTVNEGGNATLNVAANGGVVLSYQWYRNTTNSTNGSTAILNATSASYTAPTVAAGTTYYYSVVTNTDASATGSQTATATSSIAKVTVNALTHAAAPSITTQPSDRTVNEGGNATLNVAASGGVILSYQWYRNTTNSTNGSTAINGATNASYTAPTVAAGTTYYYSVVTNTDASATGSQTATATSSIAKVTVNALTHAAAPNITTQPSDRTVNEGSNATLTVAASGSSVLSYKWYRNTTNSTNGSTEILNETSASYTAPTVAAGTTYYYSVVTNTDASATGSQTATTTSNIAKVTVNALTHAAVPNITTQPSDQTVNEGGNATLNVAASGGALLSYQWYRNTTNSTIGSTAILSATSASYTAPTVAAGTTYYYSVVTNTDASATGSQTATATSSIAKVTVNALTHAAAPNITTQPSDQMVNEGGNATLTVAASGGVALSYQWYRNTTNSTNGSTAINGATNASYTAPTVAAGTTYYYSVVTNTDASATGTQTATATSSITKVTVNALTYTIAAIPDQTATTLTEGYASGTQQTKTISITNTGTGNLTNLSAAITGADFVITQPQAALDSGAPATSFTVKAKDGLTVGTYTATVTLSAANMTNVTFTVTQAVNLPNAPANPQSLVATGADRQVTLNWSTVTGATYYHIYMGTASGQYSDTVFATVTDSTYRVRSLTNGTLYYFIVKAGNRGGLSAASNEDNATPATVPAAPTHVSVASGDGRVTIVFTAPTDNGGSAITGYAVTASPGNITVTGTASPITITGLINGTSYTFTVKAINGTGIGAPSAQSSAVIPRSPSSNDDSSAPAAETADSGVEVLVLVNGKPKSAGKATTFKRNGQTVTKITVDQKKLDDMLKEEGQHAVVTVPVNGKSDVVVGELNGQMIKNMETKLAVLEIKTGRATYTLPASQIHIGAISLQVGNSVALQDIKIQIEIAAPTSETVKIVENAAAKGTFTLVVPAIDFTIRGTYGDKTFEISKFNAYVERTIALPDGIDPNKITTGVVVDPDGTVRHVPTKIVNIDGKFYAKVSSLTNSTYSVVWHPLEFSDVRDHWSKDAVNDMGSRMVIEGTGNGVFNPDRDITRAEFAAIVVRGLGLKLESGATPFSDVKASDWYGSAVNTAYSYELINGFEDGTFRPNDKITREQAMVIIAKAMTVTGLKPRLASEPAEKILHPYSDATDASEWAKSSIADSIQAGIVSGRGGAELAPQAFITRAEVAAIVQRLLQKSELI